MEQVQNTSSTIAGTAVASNGQNGNGALAADKKAITSLLVRKLGIDEQKKKEIEDSFKKLTAGSSNLVKASRKFIPSKKTDQPSIPIPPPGPLPSDVLGGRLQKLEAERTLMLALLRENEKQKAAFEAARGKLIKTHGEGSVFIKTIDSKIRILAESIDQATSAIGTLTQQITDLQALREEMKELLEIIQII